jgi:purine-binding chemotaxis protein CheW
LPEVTGLNETQFLVFTVGDRRYALPAVDVERVHAAVEVTVAPGAPESLRGVISCAGVPVPVVDLRARFGLPQRRILPSDRLLFVRARTRNGGDARLFALLVDDVDGVTALSPERVSPPDVAEDIFDEFFAGVAGGDGGVLCVPSASALFSITEEELSIIGGLVTGGEAG